MELVLNPDTQLNESPRQRNVEVYELGKCKDAVHRLAGDAPFELH
jgi:hypothetical protein